MDILRQRIQAASNDYSALEESYRTFTGSELVDNPYTSVRYNMPNITLSVSVVIPTFNSKNALEQCLIAIEQSSFNRKYPEQLEVIVVDDGSNDGTWELLEQIDLEIHLKAIQQDHYGASYARNNALAHAEGDVIICCDSDSILTFFCIEEMAKRHQILENVLLLGVLESIDPEDHRIQPAVLREYLPNLFSSFTNDGRVHYPTGRPYEGWPENICLETNHLKRYGHGKWLFMSGGGWQDLPIQVWGGLFSLRRDDFLSIDGFNEQFHGWGLEDSLLGAEAIARGNYVIPAYSASGVHVNHSDRLPNKWKDFAANYEVYQSVLQAPFSSNMYHQLDQAKQRVRRSFERAPSHSISRNHVDQSYFDVFDLELADPYKRGTYLYCLGHYNEAITAFSEVQDTTVKEAWATLYKSRALRVTGYPDRANALLKEVIVNLPGHPEPLIESAFTLATLNQFVEAKRLLRRAQEIVPTSEFLAYLLDLTANRHIEHASLYLLQEDHALAVKEYEFALIQDQFNLSAQLARANTLTALGSEHASQLARSAFINTFTSKDIHPHLQQALSHLNSNNIGGAKLALEQARRAKPHEEGIQNLLNDINSITFNSYPLPLVSRISEHIKKIPGNFTNEEIELLVALTSRNVASCNTNSLKALIEVGCYCGQGTITMGLTLQGLGRSDVRIIAVDEPTSTPSDLPARAIMKGRLFVHGLTNLVILSPEEEATPWERASQLLLINGKDDYESVKRYVERYVSHLVYGGLLLLRNYEDSFPDVRRCIDEILVHPRFELVAQAGSLIAFTHKT